MPLAGYNVRKAAQVTAFFAKNEGGSIEVLKVAKLLYLADREFMELYDLPILFDELVSMPHGPVTSNTLNYISGLEADESDRWSEFISARAGNMVGISKDFALDELDELSEAETDVLKVVWDKFGYMKAWQLRNYTHRNCPEWEDPHGSSNPIPYERVLKFLGKQERSTEIAREIDSLRSLDKFLAHAE